MKNSRTKNTIYNFSSSIFGQLLTILMQFVVRTVFISSLGKSYLGINGLFSNILSMLSIAELGVGSAILFKLYEPLEKRDERRIVVLMKFYKKAYRIIGITVAAVGVLLIPFLPYLINDYDKLEVLHINAAFIFGLYLLKSVSSYLFLAYKTAIVKADQKEYLLNLISYFFTIITGIIQIVFLLIYPKFEVYVVISVLQVIFQNVVGACLANKMYPYLLNKTAESISKEETAEILRDCGALFIYKINNAVVKGTDNIVLSMFLGLAYVGMYSNYYILYSTIITLYAKVYNSVSHSIGSLHTTHNVKHEYTIFKVSVLISAILGGTAFVGIAVVADEMITAWIGIDWVLAQPFAVLLGLELYTASFKNIISKYRTTMGLFHQAKYRPIASMLINLIVSVALVRVWGICGILVGTIVSDWTTFMWFDPLIIHKYGFKNEMPVMGYYYRFMKYFFVTLVLFACDYWICSNVLVGSGWISVIVHSVICGITTPCAILLAAYHTEEGNYLISLFDKKVLNKLKKRHRK